MGGKSTVYKVKDNLRTGKSVYNLYQRQGANIINIYKVLEGETTKINRKIGGKHEQKIYFKTYTGHLNIQEDIRVTHN